MRLLHLAAGAAAAAVLLCGLPVASAAAGQTLGVPVGQGDLSGVTCPAANDCWAVGDGGSPQTEPPGLEAAELWHGNGKHWASVQVPLPRAIWGPDSAARANGVDGLSRVTCVTRKDCWAVGWYDGGTLPGPVGFRNFILHYDGQTWTETAAPTPANTEQLGLRGVACAAANDCWAVGGGGGLTVGWLPQALHWNGHVWALAKLPVTYGRLAAVTCSGGTCWAVGSLGKKDPGSAPAQGVIALRLLHGKVSKGRVPAPVANDLRSVACTSASACWAVGTTKAGNGVVVHWSSGGVSRSALPGLASPFAVACASSVSCWAAGSDGVLHGNGRSWTAVHFPKPKHATHFRVDGLSCRSATSCWAVGEWYGDQVTALGNINGSIASLWNGSAWHLR